MRTSKNILKSDAYKYKAASKTLIWHAQMSYLSVYYKVIFSNKMGEGGVNLKIWNHYSWTCFLLKTSVIKIIFSVFYKCFFKLWFLKFGKYVEPNSGGFVRSLSCVVNYFFKKVKLILWSSIWATFSRIPLKLLLLQFIDEPHGGSITQPAVCGAEEN